MAELLKVLHLEERKEFLSNISETLVSNNEPDKNIGDSVAS